MKKTVIPLIVVVALILLGVFIYLLSGNPTKHQDQISNPDS